MKKTDFFSSMENTLTPPVFRFGQENDRRQNTSDYMDELPSYPFGYSTGIGWGILEFILELLFGFFS